MSEGGLLPPVVVELRAKASELHAELAKTKTELGEMAEKTEGTSSRMGGAMSKVTGYSKALAVGVVGVAATIGGFSVEAATSAEVVDAKLRVAIKNAGGSMEEFEPKIKATDSRLRDLGFTNDQTNTALATLTTAIKDPTKALAAMGTVTDLARAKNIPLSDSAMLVAKAMEGQTRPLKQLGIDLPTYTGGAQNMKLAQQSLATAQLTLNHVLEKYPDAANKASKGHQAYETAALAVKDAQDRVNSTVHAGSTIMQAIEGRVKGAASAYGDTLKGKVESAKAQLENMGEVIGAKVIPIISSFLSIGMKVGEFIGKHKELLIVLGGVLAAVIVPAIYSWATAMWAAATAEGAVTLPILAIIAAVVAVGVAIYELVTHWTEVWGAIKTAAQAVWDWMKGLWSWISGIFVAGFETAIHGLESAWSTVWGGIKSAASAVWDWLKGVWNWIKSIFIDGFEAGAHALGTVWSDVWGGIKTVINIAWGVIKQIGGWIVSTVIHPIQTAISGLQTIWSTAWGAIKTVAHDIAGAVATALGGIVGTIKTIVGWVQTAVTWFGSLWSSANNAESASQRAIDAAARVPTAAGINFHGSLIGGNLGAFAGPSKDGGGWIYEVPPGKPLQMVGHGGEYMLSQDMLAGRQPIDPRVKAAIAGPSMSQAALTGGAAPAHTSATAPQVTVIAQTNASAKRIASEVGWQLRAMA